MGKSRKSDVSAKGDDADEAMDETQGDADATHGEINLDKDEYNKLCEQVNAIAQPMVDRKLAKKVYKLVKKASTTDKKKFGRGIADVQRMLRKNVKGIVLLAGNVSPVDIYAHIPAVCEEKNLPYCFVPSREHLGMASCQRRASILCLIQRLEPYSKLYDEVSEAIAQLPPAVGVE